MRTNGKMHVCISGCLLQCNALFKVPVENLYICIRQEEQGVDNSGNDLIKNFCTNKPVNKFNNQQLNVWNVQVINTTEVTTLLRVHRY